MFQPDLIKTFKSLKTPFFYYDIPLLRKTLEDVKLHGSSKGYHIHYAIKANFNMRVLEEIRDAGLGIDCVSGKEIERAISAGFRGEQIAFAGVGKTDEEIRTGLQHDIFTFNCESIQEIQVINDLAEKVGKTVNIAIRLNPNVEAKTHKYITTGLTENKFGINPEKLPHLFDLLPGLTHINLTGIHFHIGSQITEIKPYIDLCERINALQPLFKDRGIQLTHINVGGGYGIDYENPDQNPIPDFESFFNVFDTHLDLRDEQQLHFELGRSIVGQCGSLISGVLFIKEGVSTNFAVIDAGMTELIRPALYQAAHHIEVLTSTEPHVTYDVVGPICESSDTFRTRFKLPKIDRGDLVAIRSVGAYGQVMSSDFNLRDRAATIYSDEI